MHNHRKDYSKKGPTIDTHAQQRSASPASVYGKPIEIISSKLKPNPDLYFFIDKLFWLSDVKPPQNYSSAYFFCIDNVSQ